ncbi:hypothetical protein [Bacillus cereus]|uniref:hypothetical protein n=1 Tax=Bacillus cereus TaxID=1396 RepID=UPI001CBCFA96|nr:hypothetical protein [Bacillus cereus]
MSLYKQLSDALLVGFFIEINKNIAKGILSTAMYQEIDLIKTEMKKRNISEIDSQKIYQEYIQSGCFCPSPKKGG